ncbi:GNAT family N-acetyltransferase [Thermoleophilum album]|jgi:CelD/BcsL family acetyltransferase involved in cellulose biosynthesis|uniref:GNAT family N-acetyltransferase n=1 Tax=Thermoleophilum album TaxID=29539 RepID=UPI0031586F28
MDSAQVPPVEFIDRPDLVREAWDRLAVATRNIFATWEWHDAWWKHLRWGRPLIAVERNRRALLPLAVRGRGPLTVARSAGFGPADELGPLAAPEDGALAASLVRQAARALPLVFLERVRADTDWLGTVRVHCVRREEWPLIDLAAYGDWEEYLASRSANFRQQLRRRRRKAERELSFRPRLATADTFERDFELLLALHELRFGSSSQAFRGARAAFHRDFARAALERGWLRLWIGESEGRPVAAVYCWRFAGVEFMYQTGRDPAFDRWAVGQVLLAETVRAALEDGVHEYRFLLGGESYKYRFATGDPGVVTAACGREPVVSLAHLSLGAARTSFRALRRIRDAVVRTRGLARRSVSAANARDGA